MTVNVQTVRFAADEKLIEYVTKKIEKLHTFHDKIIKIDVYLKLDNVVHALKDKTVEINVQVPKQNLFVKNTSKSFEESFDKALDAMATQIKRQKEKLAG